MAEMLTKAGIKVSMRALPKNDFGTAEQTGGFHVAFSETCSGKMFCRFFSYYITHVSFFCLLFLNSFGTLQSHYVKGWVAQDEGKQ